MQDLDWSQHSPRLAASGARRRPLISLTPLIDVVFILLIFFMLASSFLDWRSIVLAPPVKTAQAGGLEGAILIEVRVGGTLRLSGQPVQLADLESQIRQSLTNKPEQKVVVKPAPAVDVQAVVAVLDSLNAAGAQTVSLIR